MARMIKRHLFFGPRNQHVLSCAFVPVAGGAGKAKVVDDCLTAGALRDDVIDLR